MKNRRIPGENGRRGSQTLMGTAWQYRARPRSPQNEILSQSTRVGADALARFLVDTSEKLSAIEDQVLLFLSYYLGHWLCRKIILAQVAKVPAYLQQFQHGIMIIAVHGYEAPSYRTAGEQVRSGIILVPPEHQ